MRAKPKMSACRTVERMGQAVVALRSAGLLIALLSSACSSDGPCESHQDCAGNEECRDGVCVPDDGSGNLPRDASVVDSGLRADAGDAGISDARPSDAASTDGAAVGDASTVDGGAADGSVADAGPGVVRPNFGLVWARQLFTTSVSGQFYDRSAARYEYSTRTWDLADDGECELQVERIVFGTYTGYTLDRIEATTSSTLTVTLIPQSAGYYAPDLANRPSLLFDGSRSTAVFQLFAPMGGSPVNPLGAAGPVDVPISDHPCCRSPRDCSACDPMLDTPVRVSGSNDLTVRWSPKAAHDTFIVELYDLYRQVILRCETPDDDGQFVLPRSVAGAWVDGRPGGTQNPPVQTYLDLRYDREVTIDVDIGAGPAVLPVTFRTSQGQSNQVRLP